MSRGQVALAVVQGIAVGPLLVGGAAGRAIICAVASGRLVVRGVPAWLTLHQHSIHISLFNKYSSSCLCFPLDSDTLVKNKCCHGRLTAECEEEPYS